MMRANIAYAKALLGNKKGQGMVEYGLIIALIAVVVIVVLTTMGGKIANTFQNIVNKL